MLVSFIDRPTPRLYVHIPSDEGVTATLTDPNGHYLVLAGDPEVIYNMLTDALTTIAAESR